MNSDLERDFKDRLYEQFARIGKALANPHRLELLDILAQGEHSVEELAQEAGMSIANTSQHLQVLRSAQLVEVRKDGLYMYYRIADEKVFHLWQAIRNLSEARLAEIERIIKTFLEERETLEAVSIEELIERMDDENVVLLDVRPEEEYRKGHIPTALSVPLEELEKHLNEIPKNCEIIAYCRGPYCILADKAVKLLRAHGYRAKRLTHGLPDWKARGLPVEDCL